MIFRGRILPGFLLAALLSAGEAAFVKGPYLVPAGSPGEMQVMVQTSAKPGVLRATWRTEGRAAKHTVSAEQVHETFVYRFPLKGLESGRRTTYEVEVDGAVRKGSFLAPRGRDRKGITFYALGDTRTFPERFERVAKAMLRDMAGAPGRSTFAVHVGDYVTRGQHEHEWNEHFFAPQKGDGIKRLLATVPVLPVIGNHEAAEGLPLMHRFWPLARLGPAWYYAYDQGPVHVAVVDTESGEPFAPGSAQYRWLEEDLKTTRAPLRIVTWHSPAYSAKGGHLDYPEQKKHLVPLCENYGVQIVLCGDNHYYARLKVNGVTHLTSGGGGAPLYHPDPTTPHYKAGASTFQFMRFDVFPARGIARLLSIDVDGKILDTSEVRLHPR